MYHDLYMVVKAATKKYDGFTGNISVRGDLILLKRKGVKVFDFNAGREVALTAMLGDPIHATRSYLVSQLKDISKSKLLTEEQEWMRDFCSIVASIISSLKSKSAPRLVYAYTNDCLEIVADIADVSIGLTLYGLNKKITKGFTHVVTSTDAQVTTDVVTDE